MLRLPLCSHPNNGTWGEMSHWIFAVLVRQGHGSFLSLYAPVAVINWLTHWFLNKMVTILQTSFSNIFLGWNFWISNKISSDFVAWSQVENKWFRQCLDDSLVPFYYLQQCCQTLRDRLKWNLNQNTFIFKKMHLKISSVWLWLFCFAL